MYRIHNTDGCKFTFLIRYPKKGFYFSIIDPCKAVDICLWSGTNNVLVTVHSSK